MAARRRRRIDSYSNTTPRETNTYSRALYCKRVANNKMYLDNYHLLANTTLARNGTEEAQERQFIYTETRSSRGGGVGSTGVGEMGAQEWTETTRVEVSQRALCVRLEYTELSLACSAPRTRTTIPYQSATTRPPPATNPTSWMPSLLTPTSLDC